MSMTHKEALYAVWCEHDQRTVEKLEASIRAYIEARGLVLVPKAIEDGSPIYAALDMEEIPLFPDFIWKIAISAAPDPFKDDAE